MADNEDTAAADNAPSPKLYFIKEAREASVPQPLTGSHDLISIFKLQPLYDHYVKQKLPNNEDVPPIEPTYFPFIKQLPGKNDIRPGNYIRQLLEAPEKNYQPIHQFSTSTLRDAFSLRVGPVPGFDPSVLGTDEGAGYKQTMKNLASLTPATAGHAVMGGVADSSNNSLRPSSAAHRHGHAHSSSGFTDPASTQMGNMGAHSSHSHSSHHGHSHHGSKSSTSSPYVDKAERGEDGGREHKHKKKKKKRKHEHDHEHGHHEGDGDSEHRKKKKRKREREEHGEIDVV